MNLLLTGATGFVGQAVVRRLHADGHRLQALVRDAGRARALLGKEVGLIGAEGLSAALAGAEGVVNLAGEPVLPNRWTRARRERLRASRVDVTRGLVEAMRAAPRPPRVFVSASAVGYYGDRGDEVLTEESGPGTDFLARLCVDWEGAAGAAAALGARVVLLRTGVVLGAGGGALSAMLPPFRLGLGGPYGPGTQYAPWIHLADVVEFIAAAIAGEGAWAGPLNLVAPEPLTNRAFVQALGAVLGRPARLPAPAAALRLLLGEAASALLGGQRVRPAALEQLGYRFRFPVLEPALREVLSL